MCGWGLSSDQQINRNGQHTFTPAGLVLLKYNALQLIKYSLQVDLNYEGINQVPICAPLAPSKS